MQIRNWNVSYNDTGYFTSEVVPVGRSTSTATFTGTTTGVGTYVSGSQTGEQVFTIPHDAPASYEYQCTAHAGMKGTLNIPT